MKLHLVLESVAGDGLLDSYARERVPHVGTMIEMSAGMGHLVNVVDYEEAARRNAMLREMGTPPIPVMPGLIDGVLHRKADGSLAAGVGQLGLQARVRRDGVIGLFDDVAGTGWQVITRRRIDKETLSPSLRDTLDRLAITITHVSPAPVAGALRDCDFDYDTWFRELGASAVIVRPDFYVFAALSNLDDLPTAIDDLARQLTHT